MSEKYYKTAFCFVLEIYAEDSELQKYINLLAKKINDLYFEKVSYTDLSYHAINTAKTCFNKEKLMTNLEEIINQL